MIAKRAAANSFSELVDGWVLEAIKSGVIGFGPLICALPGVYPSVVRNAIRRLARSRGILTEPLERTLTDLTIDGPLRQGHSTQLALPVPHPLDFDWRFAAAANERLLDEWANLARPSGCLVLLGAPSVALEALRRIPRIDVTALDKNSAVSKALRQTCPSARAILSDVMRDKLPALSEVAVVVADPPWYPEHLHSFLWAGSEICRVRGHLLVSLPPMGTRPGIAEERAKLLDFATELGLRLVRLDDAALPYLSPPFERNALRADGIAGVPVNWRRGDLAVFAKIRITHKARPLAPPFEARWHEAQVRGVRVRLRPQRDAAFGDPRLISLVAGDILPTVSRRDRRRRHADVWTAGNRIFKCRTTGILTTVMEALGARQPPVERVADALGRNLDADEANLVELAAEQVSNLISVERDEQSSWIDYCRPESFAAIAI